MASNRKGGVVLVEGLEADRVEKEDVGPENRGEQDADSVSLSGEPGFGDEVVEGEEVDAVAVLDRLRSRSCSAMVTRRSPRRATLCPASTRPPWMISNCSPSRSRQGAVNGVPTTVAGTL
jgi:hypothetical protein